VGRGTFLRESRQKKAVGTPCQTTLKTRGRDESSGSITWGETLESGPAQDQKYFQGNGHSRQAQKMPNQTHCRPLSPYDGRKEDDTKSRLLLELKEVRDRGGEGVGLNNSFKKTTDRKSVGQHTGKHSKTGGGICPVWGQAWGIGRF